jgi:2-C-methyl-D-erythritol 4-phosphate cytidylyltransferase
MAKTDVLIMAAGSGERFGSNEAKAFADVGGRPMMMWSIARFGAVAEVGAITLVVAPGVEARAGEIIREHGLSKVERIVAGGDTRQDSVRLGLASLGAASEHVLVHDAARPCVSEALIARMLGALRECRAAVPVMPVVDTLIRESNGTVDAILDRVHMARAQTPQAFHTAVLIDAHRRAHARGLRSSDDGSLVLAMGEPVRTIAGERTNIKVTFADDVRLAAAILRG